MTKTVNRSHSKWHCASCDVECHYGQCRYCRRDLSRGLESIEIYIHTLEYGYEIFTMGGFDYDSEQ